MKIRTISDLQDALDREISWRLKEIIDLKSAVASSSISKPTLIRSGIALIYAHWEGFVKAGSDHYLSYINSLRLSLDDLSDPLAAVTVRSHLEAMQISDKFLKNIEIIDILRNRNKNRFNLSLSTAIDTESNLNSIVFRNIASYLNIDASKYETKFNFIDESLLSRRNKIAHGEYLDVNSLQWRDMADEVLTLIRSFKNDIENGASQGSFRKILPQTAPPDGDT